jgi:hypothetical protein
LAARNAESLDAETNWYLKGTPSIVQVALKILGLAESGVAGTGGAIEFDSITLPW